MKKKATVLFALVSMCLVVTAGIGAVSASDEAPCTTTTVSKINPDGTTTVIETFEGCSPMVVTVTPNEDGSLNITKEDRQITEEERHLSNVYKGITITPETELPVNIVNENFSLTADVLKPSEKIDASARTLYYKATAWNYHTGWGCYATSNNYDLGTGVEAWDGYTYCYAFWWNGIGAVSASDEAPCAITVFKINPDGTTTVVKTFEGRGPMVVTVTQNEDGSPNSPNITKEDRQISEDERHSSNAYKGITITPETALPVNIVNENFSLTADVLKPSEKIDASARTLYYKATAQNYYAGQWCCKISNDYDLGTGAQSWDSRTYCYFFQW